MPGLVQLIRRSHARRARADDGHLLAGAAAGGLGNDPALLEGLVDDGALDVLDRHRVLDDAEHTRALARRRAHAAGGLGEVVGHEQPLQRLLPAPEIHKLVPLRDLVAKRAASLLLVAERHAAVHAASTLSVQLLLVDGRVDLGEVLGTLLNRAVRRGATLVLDEAPPLDGLLHLDGAARQ